MKGGRKFTKLDLTSAYQQMELDEESAKLVTINTHQGLYESTRLPLGVASAPAIFQRAMDMVLQGIPHCICYLDDILITGVSDVEHLRNLEEVLRRLQDHGISVKKEKCHFIQDSVEYLGHHVDARGVHTSERKVQAIVDAPAPRNLQELRSFLGLLNYYAKFIPNLASMLHPLHTLLRADQPWKWSNQCQTAFKEAKESLYCALVLMHYDPALPLVLAADASAYGVGAVVSHRLPNGSEQPIAYAKWPEVCIMTSTTAAKTITSLRKMFARYGIPRQLVLYNSPQFVSGEFRQFMLVNGVNHIRSSHWANTHIS